VNITSKTILRIALGALIAVLLSGCGFQLAGSRPLPEPLQTPYIEVVAPYRVSAPPLEVSLRTLLQRRGARVKDSSADAGAVIRLSDLNEARQVLTIGTDSKVLEFLLVTRVTYQVNAGDKVLVPPDTLSLSRSYSFSAQQVLAKDAEEARLQEYIQTELAQLILLRMEAVMGHGPDLPSPVLSAAPTSEPATSAAATDAPASSPGATTQP